LAGLGVRSTNERVKPHIAVLALSLAALSPAAENSPFHLPIRNDDLATLGKLIRSARGNSQLMCAAALGSLESVRLPLDAGADPNIANDFAATPLMWCAGDAAKVRLLLSKGAKADARSKLGRTPLLIDPWRRRRKAGCRPGPSRRRSAASSPPCRRPGPTPLTAAASTTCCARNRSTAPGTWPRTPWDSGPTSKAASPTITTS
jgi:ankyrin repeat protein